MNTFIINPDLTASNNDEKPLKKDYKGVAYRDAVHKWVNRNKYELSDDSLVILMGIPAPLAGKKVEGKLRNGVLFLTKIL